MPYPKRAYYKYRPLYSDRANHISHEYTRPIIEACELFYATPTSFNDPFDCNLRLHANDSTDDDWIRYTDALIAQYPGMAENLTVVKEGRLWNDHPELNDYGLRNRRLIYEKSSVFCLSSSVFCLSNRPDSIPMFAYYGDDHYGIAIELQFSDDEFPCGISCGDLSRPDQLYERKIIVGDVEYLPDLPELNYHRLYGTHQLINSLMFTKFDGWVHEDEFRIFRKGVQASSVQFSGSMLTRIIFGARTGEAEIDLVKQWLASHDCPVILGKAEISESTFGLNITDFETFEP